MSPPSKLAVAASRMGLRCAGLDILDKPDKAGEAGTAVVIATAFGPSSNTETLLKQIFLREPGGRLAVAVHGERRQRAGGADRHRPQGARGEPHGLPARGRAAARPRRGAAEIAAGRAGRVLAGAVDEMTPLLHALLDRFGALARAGAEGGEELARPFDRRRNGFLAGEGGTVAVLESAAGLAARGGRALARVLAWGSAFDPTAPPSGWGRGHQALARGLRRTLERAGVEPAGIDLVVSGAAGTVDGDRLEAEVLRAVWAGAPLPPVAAPKAVTGEFGGGHLAAAVLAAAGHPLAPTPGCDEPDPELGIPPLDGSLLPAPSVVLATSLAAGGAAAWVVLGRA